MKALIVDDEIYSVRAIKNSVNWEKLGVDSFSCGAGKKDMYR